jgi:hypothetical protein
MGLGIKSRGESFRTYLTIQGAAPTGTPRIIINGPLYLTDLASDGAGTGISSVTGGFEAGMVNAELHIFSGTNFTVDSYLITVFTDTNNITIGSSAGANATSGIGVINAATVSSASNMKQGATTHIWYYDYIVDNDALEGQYSITMSAVIGGTTYYAVETYNVSATATTPSSGSDVDYE